MKIKAVKEFYDLQEGVIRKVDEEFEVSDERFEVLQAVLPDFVEKLDDTPESNKKPKAKKEVAPADELPI